MSRCDNEIFQFTIIVSVVKRNIVLTRFQCNLVGSGDSHVIDNRSATEIGKVLYHEFSSAVGGNGIYHLRTDTFGSNGNSDIGNTRTIGETHVAFHLARVLTPCHNGVGIMVTGTLAIYCRTHGVFVVVESRDGGVLINHISKIGGNDFPLLRSDITTQYLEIVHHIVFHIPLKQDATLAGRWCEFMGYSACSLIIECSTNYINNNCVGIKIFRYQNGGNTKLVV